jgi:heat shock protein HtpX
MTWLKRIGLFVAVNVLVMVTISFLLRVLGVQPYLTARGLDYGSLMAFCLIWGMGGAFISLALSRVIAKWAMGVKVVDPGTSDQALQSLVQRVHQLARGAGLSTMPEVGVYDSPDVNAFATGPTKARALVAVSSGLLQRMTRHEADGVLAHEVAHIANGDMVTMTLVQGVVNAFAMFLARVIAFAVSQAVSRGSERNTGLLFGLVSLSLEIVLVTLGAVVVAWFSRRREYRADAGGAALGGRDKMIAALEALQRAHPLSSAGAPAAVQALRISNKGRGVFRLFSTHPPLEDRIARLRAHG